MDSSLTFYGMGERKSTSRDSEIQSHLGTNPQFFPGIVRVLYIGEASSQRRVFKGVSSSASTNGKRKKRILQTRCASGHISRQSVKKANCRGLLFLHLCGPSLDPFFFVFCLKTTDELVVDLYSSTRGELFEQVFGKTKRCEVVYCKKDLSIALLI